MYRFWLGKVSQLCHGELPADVIARAPSGPARASWLAGRVLLCRAVSPLPEITYAEGGKPAFAAASSLWFNLSHSGDDIALLLSDEGEVGCDIEVLRARKNWPALAESLFCPAERALIALEAPEQQLAAFWRIWTRKEAIVKQHGGSVWQMADVDSSCNAGYFVTDLQIDGLSIAVCTPTPYPLDNMIRIPREDL